MGACFLTISRKCRGGDRIRKSSKWGDAIHHHLITNSGKMDASILDAMPSGFEKVLGVIKIRTKNWGATIFNPTTEVYEWLGTYGTPEEAVDAYINKKVEFEGVHQTVLRGRDTKKAGIWYSSNLGKWGATIRNPVTKALLWLGSYDTLEEAKTASKKDRQISRDNQGFVGGASVVRKPLGIELTKSGKWTSYIKHPVNKALLHLGTYDTINDAEVAQKAKKLEFERMFPCQRKRSPSVKALWYVVVQDPITGRSKYLGMYGSADDAEEGLSSLASSDQLVVNGDDDAIEDEANEHDDAMEDEANGEDDAMEDEANGDDDAMKNEGGQIEILFEESEVVYANGELIGQFSRMDDDLWLV